jgi:hypothetical protein
MKAPFLPTIAAVLLSACSSAQLPDETGPEWFAIPATPEQITRAETLAASTLQDPSKVDFQRIYAVSRGLGDDYLCGEINAVNKKGKYVGYRMFYVGNDGHVMIYDPQNEKVGELPITLCRRTIKTL